MHAKPSPLDAWNFYFQNCWSPFLAWTNSPIYKLGGTYFIVGIKIICWFHFWFLQVPLVMVNQQGQGKSWNMPWWKPLSPEWNSISPSLQLNGVFQFGLVYSKLLMLLAGAAETARLPLSLSLSFSTRLSKHNTTFPPWKRVHEKSLNNEQKNNSPTDPWGP